MTAASPAAGPAPTLASLVSPIEALDALFATWDAERQGAVQAYRTAIDDLHREAIRRLIAGLKQDGGALVLLKEALSDELVYGVLRHLGLVKASLQEKIETALESVRPMLASHGGNVELVAVRPPDTVEVRFLGACDGCAASQLTFVAGVKKAIQAACPEIQRVVEARGLAPAATAAPTPVAAPTGAASPHAAAAAPGTSAAPAAAAPGAPGHVRFLSPFALGALDSKASWLPAASLEEIPPDGILRRDIAGRDLLLSRSGEAITCFTNSCAHLALPLDGGEVADGVLTCPHHGFQYLLASGECLTAPAVQLEQHAVRLIDNRVEILLRS
jgi:Fe-S cluster biogenesis protein NfuA/nitrite reductase/ring-hydroxylating ferredoxin subunit